ncbi:MAG TPA: iron chelate uptake ABC transporter family permease subunit, partial [Clostridia bacterium]|nr:iron chelate uptake ABC transporter family permease subunit [Clostridia bacterium]
MTDKIKLRAGLILPTSAALLTVLLLLSISIGSVRYPLPEILTALFSSAQTKSRDILVNIRLPRILMAALVG